MRQTTKEDGVSKIQHKRKALACLVWALDNSPVQVLEKTDGCKQKQMRVNTTVKW